MIILLTIHLWIIDRHSFDLMVVTFREAREAGSGYPGDLDPDFTLTKLRADTK